VPVRDPGLARNSHEVRVEAITDQQAPAFILRVQVRLDVEPPLVTGGPAGAQLGTFVGEVDEQLSNAPLLGIGEVDHHGVRTNRREVHGIGRLQLAPDGHVRDRMETLAACVFGGRIRRRQRRVDVHARARAEQPRAQQSRPRHPVQDNHILMIATAYSVDRPECEIDCGGIEKCSRSSPSVEFNPYRE
jgi:hypothetical protein